MGGSEFFKRTAETLVSEASQRREPGEPYRKDCDALSTPVGRTQLAAGPRSRIAKQIESILCISPSWPEAITLQAGLLRLLAMEAPYSDLPSILDKVERSTFTAQQNLGTPRSQRVAGENGREYTDEERDVPPIPEEYHADRKEIEGELNARFRIYLKIPRTEMGVKARRNNDAPACLRGRKLSKA